MGSLLNRFPYYPQVESNDCGVTCLKIVIKHYGKDCDLSFLREKSPAIKSGVTAFDIKNTAEEIGFACEAIKTTLHGVSHLVHHPCILHWDQNHFVVLYKHKNGFFHISDPNYGRVKLRSEDFEKYWTSGRETGVAILLKPKEGFYAYPFPKTDKAILRKSLKKYLGNILGYQQNQLLYLLFLLLLGGGLTYVYPLSVEFLVDKALGRHDLHLVIGVLLFQLALSFSTLVVEALKGAVRINIHQKVSVNIFKDLLTKLVSLPLAYFDARKTPDIIQKIEEQRKIEVFVTENLFSFSVSLILLIGFSVQLFIKNVEVGAVFLLGTSLSVLCFVSFSKQRNTLNYFDLKLQSENRNLILETVKGIVPIKLFNAGATKVSHWTDLQEKIVDLRRRFLRIEMAQLMSSNFINQLRTLGINLYCCVHILNGRMTLGEMVAIGAILGLLNEPIQHIYQLVRSYLEALLSFKKVNEIYLLEAENDLSAHGETEPRQPLALRNVSFSYPGFKSSGLLKNVSFAIRPGKTTAIVGESGSGKTTLTKLIGRFYSPDSGNVLYGGTELGSIGVDTWRNKVGIVSQDGYIFSGTIGENIALNQKRTDIPLGRLNSACKTACIYDFVSTLPLGYDTVIGDALYSHPEIIVFDEATSQLDSITEGSILENLRSFLRNRTVVIIAHRLSTVRRADHIVALKGGRVVEEGTHAALLSRRNYYFDLWEKQTLHHDET